MNSSKDIAREMRRNGKTLREISGVVNHPKSTISEWCSDIKITEDQRHSILNSIDNRGGWTKGKPKPFLSKKYSEIRMGYRASGSALAKKGDWLHAFGCALYWGEGSKSRNGLCLANSDPYLCRLFVEFLEKCYGVDRSTLAIRIVCYDNNGINISEIEDYWIGVLKLPRECLRKSTVNVRPISGAQKSTRILKYGTCSIQLGRTDILQSIYGALEEYGNFKLDKGV